MCKECEEDVTLVKKMQWEINNILSRMIDRDHANRNHHRVRCECPDCSGFSEGSPFSM